MHKPKFSRHTLFDLCISLRVKFTSNGKEYKQILNSSKWKLNYLGKVLLFVSYSVFISTELEIMSCETACVSGSYYYINSLEDEKRRRKKICHLLIQGPWSSRFSNLCLGLPLCKRENDYLLHSVVRDHWDDIHKAPTTVPGTQ